MKTNEEIKKEFEKYAGEDMTYGARESIFGFFEPYLNVTPDAKVGETVSTIKDSGKKVLDSVRTKRKPSEWITARAKELSLIDLYSDAPHIEWGLSVGGYLEAVKEYLDLMAGGK